MNNSEKIAVIGMNCRYPGANSIEQYWENLIEGKETIHRFSDEELQAFEPNYSELKKNPNYVPARGIIDDIDKFDAGFFGFNPYEAKTTDPQHRIWLETVWNAFENAGLDPFSYKGAIGVFSGGYINTYLLNNILRDKKKYENFIRLRTTESFQIMTASDIAYLPSKTAYAFNLRGPAINVQTACSTSLVAIAQACNSLYSYESDVCVAGGVAILTPQESGYIHQEGAIPSPDGHCRPFDAKGQGTVFSNGVGVVVLKRLEDAIKDGDNVIAVIRGWALNNDGNQKVGYTAPSIEGQSKVISAAQKMAQVSPDEIRYIEAHGTGTILGDPIEISGLKTAFDLGTDRKQFCGIGSVKSNIGHTDAAAGVAAFIKLCLIAKNRIIPPSINYETPNPYINFSDTPFRVVHKKEEFTSEDALIMGVSSFGIGGTNAHIIVEEANIHTQNKQQSESNQTYIIPLSAKSKKALEQRKEQFKTYLKNNPNLDIREIAETLWNGREHMAYRSIVIANTTSDLINKDTQYIDGLLNKNSASLAFMFPGQGSQHFKMGKALYEENSIFRDYVDKGFNILKNETGLDLKEVLFDLNDADTANDQLAETSITQPALYIIQFSLAKLLLEEGITPTYAIGHSIGEFSAAAIANVFDFETGLKIVIKRGQLMQSMPSGTMYAVRATQEQLNTIKGDIFEIAAENAPDSCTISFPSENKHQISSLFEKHHYQFLPLNTSHAFHSKAFEPILEEFASFINQFELKAPELPITSCLTGKLLNPEQAVDGVYWAQQLRNTVCFYSGIKTILEKEKVTFVEIGANAHLSSALRSIPEIENKESTILTLGRAESAHSKNVLAYIKASLWTCSNKYTPPLDFLAPNVRKTFLPSYPFEKERHWIDFEYSNSLIQDDIIQKDRDSKNNSEIAETTVSILTKIWKDTIGIERIEPSDNFFYIGGTSLMSIGIVDAAKQIFKIDISLKNFFDAPTIIDFSNYIDDILEKLNKDTPRIKKSITKSEPKAISGEIPLWN